MPRVYTKTANRAARKPRTCTGCGKPIEAGQEFYTWSRRFGRSGRTYFRHVTCGRPRPTELSSRKTAVVEEAVMDADFTFGEALPAEFEPGDSYEVDLSHVEGVLGDIADAAEEVADEYESGADNMPESLQYGAQAEAMRAVAEELRDWAQNLRDFQPDAEVELPDPDHYRDEEGVLDRDAWLADAETAVDEACERIAEEAQDLTSDMPEYQG